MTSRCDGKLVEPNDRAADASISLCVYVYVCQSGWGGSITDTVGYLYLPLSDYLSSYMVSLTATSHFYPSLFAPTLTHTRRVRVGQGALCHD